MLKKVSFYICILEQRLKDHHQRDIKYLKWVNVYLAAAITDSSESRVNFTDPLFGRQGKKASALDSNGTTLRRNELGLSYYLLQALHDVSNLEIVPTVYHKSTLITLLHCIDVLFFPLKRCT